MLLLRGSESVPLHESKGAGELDGSPGYQEALRLGGNLNFGAGGGVDFLTGRVLRLHQRYLTMAVPGRLRLHD